MTKIITFFLLLISIPFFILAFLGFVPGVSNLLASNKPKDLGITYTDNDFMEIDSKIYIKRKIISDDYQREFYFSPENHFIDQTLTSQQVTAFINQRAWKHYPFTNLQMRFNQDNTVEVSGNVDIKKLVTYIQVLGGMSDDEAKKVSSYIILKGTPAFYLKFAGNIENNQIDLKFSKAKIGHLPISQGMVSSYTPRLIEFIEKNTLSHPSINFKELRPDNGLLKVVGTLPDIESVK